MDQHQIDMAKLERAHQYFTNELGRAGVVVQDSGYSLPGYGDDWASMIWLDPGPKGFTVWIRLFRRGKHRGSLRVSDHSDPFEVEDLETVGPSVVAKLRQILTSSTVPS